MSWFPNERLIFKVSSLLNSEGFWCSKNIMFKSVRQIFLFWLMVSAYDHSKFRKILFLDPKAQTYTRCARTNVFTLCTYKCIHFVRVQMYSLCARTNVFTLCAYKCKHFVKIKVDICLDLGLNNNCFRSSRWSLGSHI